MRTKIQPTVAAAVFLAVALGGVAGLVPWLLSRWRMAPPFQGIGALRWLGVALIAVGTPILLGSYVRFVRAGSGTPAPI